MLPGFFGLRLLPDTKKPADLCALTTPFLHVRRRVSNEQWGWCGTTPQKKRPNRRFGTSVTQEYGQKPPRPPCKRPHATNQTLVHLIYASVSFRPAPFVFLRKVRIVMKMARGAKEKRTVPIAAVLICLSGSICYGTSCCRMFLI